VIAQHKCQCCGESLAKTQQPDFTVDGDCAVRSIIARRFLENYNGNNTALHKACECGHLEVARFLIVAGGAELVRAANIRNWTALHLACWNGHLEVVRLLAEAGGAELVMAVADGNRTALHLACQNGHLEVVRLLVEMGGAELVRAGDNTNSTALHFACKNGHLEVARFLTEPGGAELVMAGGDANWTALHLACQDGHLEVARLLVAAGGAELVKAMVNDTNATALHNACKNGHLEVARLLVAAGGAESVRVGDNTNSTALHFACAEGHLEVARLLIEVGGAELTSVESDSNWTALHRACRNGHLEVARFLLKEGGLQSIYVKVGGGQAGTPIDLASDSGHTDIVRLLTDEKERGQLDALNSFFDNNEAPIVVHGDVEASSVEATRANLSINDEGGAAVGSVHATCPAGHALTLWEVPRPWGVGWLPVGSCDGCKRVIMGGSTVVACRCRRCDFWLCDQCDPHGLVTQLHPQILWTPISLIREMEEEDEAGEDGDESLLAAALALSLGKDAVDDNEEKHDAND
jgi:ankyrin repeat protein